MRIAHFSDVHFTRKPADFPLRDLISKRGVGWLNLTVRRRYKRFLSVAQVVSAFLHDLEEQKPDLILFTGDLTAVAYAEEFQAAAEAFSDLRERSCVLGVPGNHDVYVRKANGEQLFNELFHNWTGTDRPDLARAGHALPAARLLGSDLAVIAIPSARSCALTDSSGLVGHEGLLAIDRVLSDPDLTRRKVIVALHYGFFLEDGKRDSKSHGLRDADQVLALLKHHDVDLIVHGHIHERFVHLKGTISPVSVANTGSLTDSKFNRAYHIYEMTRAGFELQVRRYSADSDEFELWPDAPGSGLITFCN
jgi:3',5'-cyclic AMP phosphodiesterase CpdA